MSFPVGDLGVQMTVGERRAGILPPGETDLGRLLHMAGRGSRAVGRGYDPAAGPAATRIRQSAAGQPSGVARIGLRSSSAISG